MVVVVVVASMRCFMSLDYVVKMAARNPRTFVIVVARRRSLPKFCYLQLDRQEYFQVSIDQQYQ